MSTDYIFYPYDGFIKTTGNGGGGSGGSVSNALTSNTPFQTQVGDYLLTFTSNGGFTISGAGVSMTVASGAIVASGADGESMVLSGGTLSAGWRNDDFGADWKISAGYGGVNLRYNDDGAAHANEVDINSAGVHVNSCPVLTALVTSTDAEATSATFAVLSGGTSYIFTQPLTSIGIANISSGARAEFDFTADAGFDLSLPASAKRFGVSSYDSGSHYLIAVDGARVVVVPYETGA